MGRPQTFDHLRSQKKPITRKVTLCFDSELQEEWERAQVMLSGARDSQRYRPGDEVADRIVEDAEAALESLRPKIDKVTVTFTFRGIGRKRFDALLAAHPPTAEQIEKGKKDGVGVPQFNYDSFPQELIALSCTSPELSLDDVKEMWDSDDWSSGELTLLYDNAMQVNQQRGVIDLGKG